MRWQATTRCVLLVGLAGGCQKAIVQENTGDPDSGVAIATNIPPPGPAVTTSTSLGNMTGQDAFPVYSAADQVSANPDSLAVTLSDSPQCFPAEVDGGPPGGASVVHWLSATIRELDGGTVTPGTYPLGPSANGEVETDVALSTFDQNGDNSDTLVAMSGSVTLGATDGGVLSGSFNVIFDDTYASDPLALSGTFQARSCGSVP